LSEAAANTITPSFSEGVYAGAGVGVTATAVVVEGDAVVSTGVETTLAGCMETVVGIAVG